MKNVKKSLALLLAFVMILGMSTMGASAAFEGETIQYNTPVQVMAGMGILEGNQNGDFNPTGNLTRAAAAKIVAYVALGKSVADKLPATDVFKDLKSTDPQYGYAAKFVSYLYTMGIVNGYGDGKFGPGDPVTVLQFAKMLLCAIGYGKDGEYTGAKWEVATMVDADIRGILKDILDSDLDRVITREEASLFAFNTLTDPEAKTVTYSSKTGEYTPSSKTLGESKYNLATTFYGVVSSNQVKGNTYTVVTNSAGIDLSLNVTTDKSLLGKYVAVYYRDKKNTDGVSYNPYSIEEIGTVKTYAYNPFSTATAAAQQTIALGVSTVSFAPVWWSFAADYGVVKNTSGSTSASGTYILYESKVVSYIANPTYIISKVTAISTVAGKETITLNGVNSNQAIDNKSTKDDVIEYTGIAVGDYVTVTTIGNKYYLTKNTTVEGTISSISKYVDGAGVTKVSTVVLDGNTYSLISEGTYGNTTDSSTLTDIDLVALTSFNGTYTLYLDENNKIYSVQVKDASTDANLFYCTGVFAKASSDGINHDWFAKGANAKGEAVEYKFNSDQSPSTAITGASANVLYYVSNISVFGVATLVVAGDKAVAINGATGDWTITEKGVSKLTYGGKNYYLSSDVTIVYVSDANPTKSYAPKVTVKSGATNLTLTTNDYLLATAVPGTPNYTVHTIFRGQAASTTAASLAYIYCSANDAAAVPSGIVSYAGAFGTSYANTYTAYIDGEKKTINVSTLTTSLADGFYTYSVDAYGIYSLTATTTGCKIGTVRNYYNGYISFGSENDVNTSNAVLVNLTGNNYVPTSIALLNSNDTIAVDYDNVFGTSADYIYVIDSQRVG